MTHIMLVGNPNCGKTTLFNALTGDNQRVGNWPGVTVEKKMGEFLLGGEPVQLTDLPGVYSLVSTTESRSQDEQIAAEAVAFGDASLFINVVDASHLERHLYLTSQLLELGKPVIVALSMNDLAQNAGITIDVDVLSKQLKCPVVVLEVYRNLGRETLKTAILKANTAAIPLQLPLSAELLSEHMRIEAMLLSQGVEPTLVPYLLRRTLEGDKLLLNKQGMEMPTSAMVDIDILMADARYQAVHQVVLKAQRKQGDSRESMTARLDRIVLHRVLALPIFLMMMYLMFLFAINLGGAFQDFFDISSDAIFVQGAAHLLTALHLPDWVIALTSTGLGKGINTTLTFIPVIAAMFFFLSLLESSGYMARAAFVVDKAMRTLGLPGKAFVPMIVGFGCNVPAIMAARTLDTEQDRLLTILMTPFMSCSARLAIYAVFVAAFFPVGGQNIVFCLYLIGILMAVFTGFLLRKTLFQGVSSPLILELPAYHRPQLKPLLKDTLRRLRYFIFRAGKVILPVSVLLGGLNALTIQGSLNLGEASSVSVLSILGQWLTPLFAPIGLHQDNWPATVGLLSGMLAKEVVIGSLNTLYAQMGHLVEPAATSFSLLGSLESALWSIPEHIMALGDALVNPLTSAVSHNEISRQVYGVMAAHFDGKEGAFAYLLFILLYIPCVSTMAAIKQEASHALMWFSIVWSFIVAYAAAGLFYQLATFHVHPQQSMAWVLGIVMLVLGTFGLIKVFSLKPGGRHVIANS